MRFSELKTGDFFQYVGGYHTYTKLEGAKYIEQENKIIYLAKSDFEAILITKKTCSKCLYYREDVVDSYCTTNNFSLANTTGKDNFSCSEFYRDRKHDA